MRTIKTCLATIAMLLCSITANAKTSTYYDDWESGNKVEQGSSDGQIFSITANPGDMPTFDCSLNSESSYSSTSIVASGTCGTNLTWELTNEGELTISGTGEMENYESRSKYPWYSYQSAIKSVIINEGVTSVGDYAFLSYTNLINLSLPNTLKIIGKKAFDTCEKLTSLIIPEGCKTIEYGAFLYCSGLNTITLPNSLTSIGDYAFASCWNIESLFIPEKVEFIGELAFRATTKLNTIRVNSNNTTFDSRNDCNAIIETNTNKLRLGCSSTTIPNDIVIIGNGAFHSQNLSVTIPQSVKTVESWAFNGSSGQIKILCKTPPTIEHQNAFSSSTAEIHVPYGCLECYADEPWYTFRKNGKLKEFVPNIQSGTCGENLTYSLDLDYGELTISGTGEMENYESSSKYPWYSYQSAIKSVIIKEGVTSIGSYAFRGCSGLTSITIPNSVTSIGAFAFRDCSSLKDVVLPERLTSLERAAFCYCKSLESIVIPGSVATIGREAFGGCEKLSSVTISEGVKTICDCAFYDCPSLTNLTIPYSVTTFEGTNIFGGTTSLGKVNVSCNWEKGKLYNFSYLNIAPHDYDDDDCSVCGDKRIMSGTWSENITYTLDKGTGELTLSGTGDLETSGIFQNISSKVKTTVIEDGITSIGDGLFNGCPHEKVIIPKSVKSIGVNAFMDNPYLKEATLPDGLVSIGDWAFVATGLISVTIPNSVTSIGENAFMECDDLTSVTIPNSVTSIGKSAFAGCYGLTSIVVEDGNSVYDSRNNCNAIIETATNTLHLGIATTIIPNSVTSIGDYAFYCCSGLTSVTIPNSVTSIGENAFDGCYGLTSVTIPNSVTSIGDRAFSYCSGLTSVTIGNSVTSIASYAFSYCEELLDVYCYAENVPSVDSNVFYSYQERATLHVPAASLESYKSTSPWSSFGNFVALPPSEVSLEDGVEYENNTDEYMSQITYTRTLSKTNTWNALYVPFEIPMTEEFLEDYDVAYFNDIHSFDNYIGDKENNVLGQDGVIDGMEMEVLKVHEGDVLNANYPYLIRAKNTDALNMNIVIEDATLYQAKETTISCSSVFMKFDVTGIYTTQTAGELKGEFDVYAMSGGGWKQALNTNQQLKPFRLYLSLSTINGSPVKVSESAMSRINIRVQGEDTETGIDELKGENGNVKTEIFDLSGRRVQKAQKGIFIQNGKKVIM